MSVQRIKHLLSVLFIMLPLLLQAQENKLPRGEDLEIKLVTIGPGDDVPSWWGHTALIVEDRRFKSSVFYNYGLFSFEEKNFFINFAMGRLIFWVGAWKTSTALAYYVSVNREIRMQVLNLSPSKKVEMAEYLAINVRPENRAYLYDHYRDNCSTRVRDLIDKIIDGQFYSQMQGPGKYTYREHTRRHTDRSFAMDWLLMFLMSDVIDKPTRQWDDMFLPEDLSIYVQNLRYSTEEGQRIPLVETAYTYYEAKNRPPLPEGVPVHWPYGLLYGLIFGSLIVISAICWKKNYRFANKAFAGLNLVEGIVFGIPGFILFFLSYFTNHTVTYGNENLLLANPLTLLFIPLAVGILLEKRGFYKWAKINSYALALSGIILLPAKLLPAFDQQNTLSICLILPVSLATAFSWYYRGKNETEVG